jgi:uncharacterized membrane protein
MNDKDFWSSNIRKDAVLSPIDRISEILFGLIMVLTFTGTISATHPGKAELRDLLWSALGCNLAWGIIDAMMYLMNIVLSRAYGLSVVKRIRNASDSKLTREIIKEEIPPVVSSLLTDEELDRMGIRLKQLEPPTKRHLLTSLDFMAAIQIFLLVFLCTLPVALPFAWVEDTMTAMRISNGVALFLLFIGGFKLAQYAELPPWITAALYTLVGLVMVSLTMALGG